MDDLVKMPKVHDRTTEFLADLTAMCMKHRIGITGNPVLFIMEDDDYSHTYAADEDSRLYRR